MTYGMEGFAKIKRAEAPSGGHVQSVILVTSANYVQRIVGRLVQSKTALISFGQRNNYLKLRYYKCPDFFIRRRINLSEILQTHACPDGRTEKSRDD